MAKFTDRLGGVFGALADPTRRAVIEALRDGPQPVSAVAAAHPMALSSFLKHIRALESAGIVRTAKVGRVRTCALVPDGLDPAAEWMRDQAEFWDSALDRLGERRGDDRPRDAVRPDGTVPLDPLTPPTPTSKGDAS